MPHVSATVPEANLLLCEHCGYVLSGLGGSERCPECGRLVAESDPALRQPCQWEKRPGAGSFISTTWMVLVRPTQFFRSLAIRTGEQSRRFAAIHFALASVILGAGLWLHAGWYLSMAGTGLGRIWVLGLLPCIGGTFLMLLLATELGGRATAWEAAYRGLRLPIDVVRRSMHYHSAHYFPVAVFTFITIAAYRIWDAKGNGAAYGINYLYILCGEIIVFAAYLFKTYWIGMRNVMYANS